MSELDAALAANRAALDHFLAEAERCEAVWHTPRAPGKWSPAQLSEHVARSLEESANEAAGMPSKFPTLPSFVRPAVRGLFFKRVLKNEGFPKARTSGAFNPIDGPATPAAARARLEGALARLDQACRAAESAGRPVESGLFGPVSVSDYARFQAIHTRHHGRQFPGSG